MRPFLVWSNILLVLAVADFCLGLFVFLKNRSKIINQAFFASATGISLWIAGIGLIFLFQDFILNRLIFVGAILMFGGLLAFARVFPLGNKPPPIFWLYLVPLAVLALLIPLDLFVSDIKIYESGWVEPVNGPLMPLFAAVFACYLIYTAYLLRKSHREALGLAKTQVQYFFLGAMILFASAVVFDAILPAMGIFDLSLVGPASSSAFIAITAYAIVRHRLMDIKVVIQRGAIYTTLAVILTGLYLTGVFVAVEILHQQTRVSALVSGALTLLIGVFGAPVLERYFRRITDRIFFKDKYDYQAALAELSDILNRNLELGRLVKELSESLVKILRAEKAEFLLGAKTRRSKGGGVAFPIDLKTERLGFMVLGEKKSGGSYTPEDYTLLKTVASQTAVAVKRAELYEEVADYSKNLEEKVKERTAEVKRLQEEQKQMMLDISHGLLNPLTTIKGELGYIRKREPSRKKFLAFERSLDKVSRFVYDLLRLAKLESANDPDSYEVFDLSGLLCATAEYLGVLARENKILLEAAIKPKITVLGNKENLEELTVNLASNAFRYMSPRGPRRVKISLRKSGGRAILEIRDTGIGIRKEDLGRVFERFYRTKESLKNHATGTGLGLAICKKIVENHRGTIKIESVFGRGTTVTVTLPAR